MNVERERVAAHDEHHRGTDIVSFEVEGSSEGGEEGAGGTENSLTKDGAKFCAVLPNYSKRTSGRGGGQVDRPPARRGVAGQRAPSLLRLRSNVASRPARQVRVNLVNNICNGDPAVIMSVIMRSTQVALICGVLLKTQDAKCDEPLRLFLAVTAFQQCFVCLLHLCKRPGVRPEQQPHSIQVLENVIGMAILAWFFCGNVWTFNSVHCDPTLRTASMVLILFVYCCLALPLFLVLLIIFCLPCFALFLPLFVRYFPEAAAERAATDEQIASLQIRHYEEGDYDAEDANCCICLDDYREGSELRVLPCSHHFHRACVDTWLISSAVCPLCKDQPFVQREAADEGGGLPGALLTSGPLHGADMV